jgi:GxxExxY protein
METNDHTREILGAAMKVHSVLGPGLLESVYRRCLCYELVKRGRHVILEKPVRIWYDGVDMGSGLRIDLLVEESVIVEVKSVERMIPVYQSQILSHMKLSGITIGLLINFNVRHLRHGIQRFVR